MTSKRRATVVGSWIMLCVICAGVTVAFITPTKVSHSGINGYWKSSFVGMLKGTAYKPFVYRRLVPEIISLVVRILPSEFQTGLAQYVSDTPLAKQTFERLRWDHQYALEYTIFVVLAYCLFLWFSVIASKFIVTVLNISASSLARRLISCVLLLGLPPFFKFTTFIYDPAQLVLFTASLYYLYHRRWMWYVVFFALTCLNKETAILLIPVFMLHYPLRLSDRRAVLLVAAQTVIFVTFKAVLTVAYAGNPGSFVEFQFVDHNLLFFARGYGWTQFLLLGFFTFVWLYKWKEKPAFLRTAFICTLPPLVALSLFLGWIDEWRGYYEAYPVVFAMAIHTFASLHKQVSRAS
jgi:hypothetical protein